MLCDSTAIVVGPTEVLVVYSMLMPRFTPFDCCNPFRGIRSSQSLLARIFRRAIRVSWGLPMVSMTVEVVGSEECLRSRGYAEKAVRRTTPTQETRQKEKKKSEIKRKCVLGHWSPPATAVYLVVCRRSPFFVCNRRRDRNVADERQNNTKFNAFPNTTIVVMTAVW